jgi:hypothetical protein
MPWSPFSVQKNIDFQGEAALLASQIGPFGGYCVAGFILLPGRDTCEAEDKQECCKEI